MISPKIIGWLVLVVPATVLAEVDPYSLSLEDLMNVPVTVSSRKALSQRETPGIVTVITGEEIRHSGARDLVDVLRQVPGMDFRATVNNGIALGMRGQIGSDGRILMLVDGIEVNEHRYGSAIVGQNYPLEQIARIEIIRGSAMALYGGKALLGVINIISKNAEELNGLQVGGGIGRAESGARSRDYASLMAGKGGDTPVKLTAMAHVAKSLRSDRTYQDVSGPSYNMADASAIDSGSLNLGLQAGNFSARYLHENLQIDDRDGSGNVYDSFGNVIGIRPAIYKNYYYSDALQLQHRYQVNNQLTLAPSLLYQTQNPRKTVSDVGVVTSETSLRHVQAILPAIWDADVNWHLAGGVEYLGENYQGTVRPFPLKKLPFNSTSVGSIYGEVLWRNPWGDMTTSLRLDEHSHAGLLRAGRLGYTKIMGDWHVKLMGSYADRAPSIEGYAAHPTTAIPESARTWEMETGYRISSDAQLSLNLFDVTTYDTLIITNSQKVHTRGMEAAYKIRKEWGYADVSYSHYNANGTDTFAVQVTDSVTGQVVDSSSNLAFPSNKLTSSLHYNLSSGLSLNPSLVYLGSRWGYVAPDPTGQGGTLKHFGATPIVNVALYWENGLAKGMNITLGLYNALNREVDFISPLNAYHAPLPDMSREVVMQAQYKF